MSSAVKPLQRLTAAYQRLPPRRIVTWDKSIRIWKNLEIWDDPDSVVHRLPHHYKMRYWENLLKDREPVHYELPEHRFDYDSKKNIKIEREAYPIVPIFPEEADKGLWAGEGIVKGYHLGLRKWGMKANHPRDWWPKYWWPNLKRAIVHSEILDKYMNVVVTERALRKIDDHFGLDFYLLKTADLDLSSKLACRLKRELYISLAKGADYYDENPEKQTEIRDKYKDFLLPLEEAEWIGLDLNEACRKQQDLEDEQPPRPLKLELEAETVQRLREELKEEHGATKTSSWILPFRRKHS